MEIKSMVLLLSCGLIFGCDKPPQKTIHEKGSVFEIPLAQFGAKEEFFKAPVKEPIVEIPKNYWKTFPDADVDKIVIRIHTTEEMNPIFPDLFLKNHPAIKDFTIDDRDEATRLARSITGASGVAGAKLFKHHRTFSQEMGTISFYFKEGKFDVIISNVGFFMGPELNDFHLFYSWRLAKLVNDVALKHGPGLCQMGFNSLSGASSIAGEQFLAICGGEDDWDGDRYHLYKQRPANVWDIFPGIDEWPEKTKKKDR